MNEGMNEWLLIWGALFFFFLSVAYPYAADACCCCCCCFLLLFIEFRFIPRYFFFFFFHFFFPILLRLFEYQYLSISAVIYTFNVVSCVIQYPWQRFTRHPTRKKERVRECWEVGGGGAGAGEQYLFITLLIIILSEYYLVCLIFFSIAHHPTLLPVFCGLLHFVSLFFSLFFSLFLWYQLHKRWVYLAL